MNVLDYVAVDDLGFAAERGRLPDQLPSRSALTIGPVVELLALDTSGLVPVADWGNWLDLGRLQTFGSALHSGTLRWQGARGDRIGIFRSPAAARSNGELMAFSHSAQVAAEASGFSLTVARQLAACVGELHSNIVEHSGAVESGLLAFSTSQNFFELTVADSGAGVLESLRSCREYAYLNDYGEALRLAQTEGVSRHGVNTGRGMGFRPLFIGLANLSASIRFRSGNAALVIEGTNKGIIAARIQQKPSIKGFSISVCCQANNAASRIID